MNLGPLTGRDLDLCEVIYGYMSNPHCAQNQANRIPLLTCADYSYNPWSYDPGRSIGQSILHLTKTQDERQVLKRLVEKGNTVIVIEHNLEVVKCADWIVDMGPGGGIEGGEVVATGTPEKVAKNSKSHTGFYLRSILK